MLVVVLSETKASNQQCQPIDCQRNHTSSFWLITASFFLSFTFSSPLWLVLSIDIYQLIFLTRTLNLFLSRSLYPSHCNTGCLKDYDCVHT